MKDETSTMGLVELEKLWLEDSKINEYQLATESISIPKLHSKYYNLYIREKLKYSKLKQEEIELDNILTGFYGKTLTIDELDQYDLVYDDKKILKPDIPRAIDCNKEMIKHRLDMAMSYEKVEFLKSILNMVQNRSFQIKNAIEVKKFEAGA